MSITQTLTPFDSSKQAIEGTSEFRANASYSWSWLIEHTNQQIALIDQINSTMSDMNSLAQTVTTKAQEVSTNTGIVNQAKTDTLAARDITLNAKSAVESMTGLGLTGLANGDTLEYDSSVSKFKNTNLHSKTAKTTPVDADEMMIADSTTTFSLKKITWSSIKTTIKTYLDTYFIPKVATPTTNALAKIQADGTIKNSGVIEGTTGNILIGTSTDNGVDRLQVNGSLVTTSTISCTQLKRNTNSPMSMTGFFGDKIEYALHNVIGTTSKTFRVTCSIPTSNENIGLFVKTKQVQYGTNPCVGTYDWMCGFKQPGSGATVTLVHTTACASYGMANQLSITPVAVNSSSFDVTISTTTSYLNAVIELEAIYSNGTCTITPL